MEGEKRDPGDEVNRSTDLNAIFNMAAPRKFKNQYCVKWLLNSFFITNKCFVQFVWTMEVVFIITGIVT